MGDGADMFGLYGMRDTAETEASREGSSQIKVDGARRRGNPCYY